MSREGASKRAWPGLMPTVRRFFLGAASPPKAKRYSETSTPTTSRYYEGMNESYRWFRQDELVRRCILTGAFFATMTAGFETAHKVRCVVSGCVECQKVSGSGGGKKGQFVEVSGTDGEVALFDYSTPGDWWDVVGELEEDAADADTTAKIWLGVR